MHPGGQALLLPLPSPCQATPRRKDSEPTAAAFGPVPMLAPCMMSFDAGDGWNGAA
jgi:hypothetical protein